MVYKVRESLMMGILSGVKRLEFVAILATCVTISILSPAILFAGDNGPCIECHTKPDKLKVAEKAKIDPVTGEIKVSSMLIDEASFKASAHGGEDFFC
ncbi:MAG: hypothetical protein AAB283_08220, partial [Planctomycetota bacterium]